MLKTHFPGAALKALMIVYVVSDAGRTLILQKAWGVAPWSPAWVGAQQLEESGNMIVFPKQDGLKAVSLIKKSLQKGWNSS